MKKLLLFFLSIHYISASEPPPPSPEQVERNKLYQHITLIKEQFASMIQCGTPDIFDTDTHQVLQATIKDFLQSIGTPVSSQVYKELYPKD